MEQKFEASSGLTEQERIAALAEHVWGSRDGAQTFLETPHALLGGQSPQEASVTEGGAQKVERILWNIVHGIVV